MLVSGGDAAEREREEALRNEPELAPELAGAAV
jgi:hypothetical protein